MNRWKVWREWPLPSETPDAWEPWCAWDGEQLVSARFRTHAKALAYADRMARTITVTLPRGVNEVSVGPNAWLELRADGGASVHGGCGSTGIRKYALERTALALLAHARKDAT